MNNFRLGVEICAQSGKTVDQLVEVVAKDRFTFAQAILADARRSMRADPPQYRIAVARAYYAMYHAARTVVYYTEKGDDHEAHSEIPKYIPRTFPDRDKWENELKNSRLERNRADYDPYPKRDIAFMDAAITAYQASDDFIRVAKEYLRKQGCPV